MRTSKRPVSPERMRRTTSSSVRGGPSEGPATRASGSLMPPHHSYRVAASLEVTEKIGKPGPGNLSPNSLEATPSGWRLIPMNEKLNSVWWALRVGLGLGPFLAGLDKFFNVLTDWSMYLSPLMER